MDKVLVCRDCGQNFTFTEGEQEFFTARGYSEPQRCPDCRAAKKAARGGGSSYGSGGGGYSDSYSSGGSSYGSGGGYGGGGGGGYSDRPARQMTQVVCSNCGKDTQVPFVPSGDRPVYCSDCFSQMGGGSRGGSGGGGRSGGGSRSRY